MVPTFRDTAPPLKWVNTLNVGSCFFLMLYTCIPHLLVTLPGLEPGFRD